MAGWRNVGALRGGAVGVLRGGTWRAAWRGEREARGGFRGSKVVLARLRCCWQRDRGVWCLYDVCCAAAAARVDRVGDVGDGLGR